MALFDQQESRSHSCTLFVVKHRVADVFDNEEFCKCGDFFDEAHIKLLFYLLFCSGSKLPCAQKVSPLCICTIHPKLLAQLLPK